MIFSIIVAFLVFFAACAQKRVYYAAGAKNCALLRSYVAPKSPNISRADGHEKSPMLPYAFQDTLNQKMQQ